MTELAQSYAAIVKSEKQEDGTLKVYGKATDDSIDIDQQICDETWLAKAMPDWFVSGGNVREQHSNIAAGVATDYEKKEDGHYITALVVDPVSVKKVERGVLKGFSIGIRSPRVVRDTKAAGGRIVDGQIVEVSLVDRPANPNAKLMLAKAAEGGQLMAVEQMSIPSPAELMASSAFARKDAEPETPIVDEPVAVDEVVADEPATEVVADVVVDEAPVAETVTEDASVADAVAPEAEIVDAAKGLLATLNKFDQATYDNAVSAVADLIIVEATEMKLGSDERDSIKELLRAAKHLSRWYEGEAEAGEVAGVIPEVADELFLSADKSDTVVCECECESCGEDKGCDAKLCKCDTTMSADKSVTVDDETISTIIDKAVASAKASVTEEIDLLKSALEAEAAKSVELQTQLDTALKATVAGGPKRATLTKSTDSKPNDYLVKAADYRAKADNTNDKLLADGYRQLARDFEAKAEKESR